MNDVQAAYVAGFLDGDGSIHFQLVRQKEYRYGFYIRASVSLTQCTAERAGLELLQVLLGGGYVRDRGTGMSDLVITSRPLIERLLVEIEPYVVFKKPQVVRALELLPQLGGRVTPEEFLRLARHADEFATLNHSKTKRIFAADVERHLRGMGALAPVTTSSEATPRRGSSLPNTPAP